MFNLPVGLFKKILTYLLGPFNELSIARFALRALKSSEFLKKFPGAPPPNPRQGRCPWTLPQLDAGGWSPVLQYNTYAPGQSPGSNPSC